MAMISRSGSRPRAGSLCPPVQRGDLFIANTNYTRGRILEIGAPEAKTVKLPVGLYPDRFPFRARTETGNRAVRFLSIGRLVEKKGHIYAIEALALVRAAGIDASLTIIGEGPTRGDLEAAIARLGLGEHARLLGRRTQEEVARLADVADIFVLASTSAKSATSRARAWCCRRRRPWACRSLPATTTAFRRADRRRDGLLVTERDPPALARR